MASSLPPSYPLPCHYCHATCCFAIYSNVERCTHLIVAFFPSLLMGLHARTASRRPSCTALRSRLTLQLSQRSTSSSSMLSMLLGAKVACLSHPCPSPLYSTSTPAVPLSGHAQRLSTRPRRAVFSYQLHTSVLPACRRGGIQRARSWGTYR